MPRKARSSNKDRLTRLQAEAAATETEKKTKKATKKAAKKAAPKKKATARRSKKATSSQPGEGPRMKYVWQVHAGTEIVAEFAWPKQAEAEAHAVAHASETKTPCEVVKAKVPLED